MKETKTIQGIHHITAISGSATENVAFYEKILGLKLVKQTVNFDDPFTYHLYYGNQQGSPGTILTFFPWIGIPRGVNGQGMVTAIAFETPAGTLDYWKERLALHDIATTLEERFGEEVLRFSDPHGLNLELIATGENSANSPYVLRGTEPLFQISGFHSATATLSSLRDTENLLVNHLGMELQSQKDLRYRFKMKNDALRAIFYDVIVDPQSAKGRQGSGSVHHIAFRTTDDKEQLAWRRSLLDSGYAVTGVRDRKYFQSIYFNEPGGVLFEIATDPPGFTVDESLDSLGESLQLPDTFESIRSEIEKSLPPLRSDTFIHEYVEASESENKTTIVTLHGTGGNEHDLIPLAQKVAGGAAILSPRGKVTEGDMNRFFARLSSGAFDKKDIILQAGALAKFLQDAAIRYKRPVEDLTAMGYSNGANIAAAMLLLHPAVFSKAILLRPMLPLLPQIQESLVNKEILILRGKRDTVIPQESTDQLIRVLTDLGAEVDVVEIEGGHQLTEQDIQIMSRWLSDIAKKHYNY